MTKLANFSTCCRLCLADNVELKSIFDDCGDDRSLQQKISSSLGVEITSNDKLPTLVCFPCIDKVNSWQSFKITCSENQSKLEQWLTGSDLGELTIHIKEEPLDSEGPSSVELVSGEIRVKNEVVQEEFEELPPPLTPQNFTEDENELPQVPIDMEEDNDFDPKRCMTCGKIFSSLANRKKHEKNIHGIKRTGSVTGSDLSSAQEDQSQSSIASTTDQTPAEPSSEEQKIQFAAGLKLLQRNSTPPISSDDLSPLELSYLEKCKAMVTMHDTRVCACHNVLHPNQKRLLSHLRSIGIWFPVFTCYHCMITFTDRSASTKHYVRCMYKNLGNLVKMSNLKKRSEVKTRLYQNYKCTKCQFVFWFHEDFCKHVDEDHSDVSLPTTCKCTRTFTSLEDYRDHAYVSCLVEYLCDICKITVNTLDAFQKHAAEVHDNEPGFELRQDDNYRKRKSAVFESPPERRNPTREYTDPTNIISGKRRSSYKPPIIEPEIDLPETKVINPLRIERVGGNVCPICSKKYSNNNNMFRHYKTHFENRDDDLYACPDCKGMFNAEEWEKHKETHQKKTCNECGKVFQFESELDQHRSVHLNIKLYRDSKTQSYKSTMASPNSEEGGVMVLCEICDKMFTTKEELKQHKLTHNVANMADSNGIDKRYKCNHCDKEYARRSGLWEHTRTKHPGHKMLTMNQYPKKCNFCDKVLSTGGAYFLHQQVHKRAGVDIGQISPPIATAREPKDSTDNDDSDESYFTCKKCFKVFSSRSSLKMHMKSHGIIGGVGKTPKKSPKRAWNDNVAMLDDSMPNLSDEHEDMKEIKAPFVFTCDICVQTFTTKAALKKHKEKHVRESNIGAKKANKNVYCKFCKVAFENDLLLMKHMQEEHIEKKRTSLPDKQQKFQCPKCPKSFSTAWGLHGHRGWHSRPSAMVKEETAEPAFKCKTCGTAHANDTALQIHILEKHRNVDAIVLPSRCKECNMDFATQAEYEKHRKLHDVVEQRQKQQSPKPRTFACRECPAAFSRGDRLNFHTRQFHPQQQKFRCSQCDRVFDKQTSLQIHLKVHEKQKMSSSGASESTKTPLFSCSICNKGFDVPKDLRMHTIQEHPF